MKNKKMLIIFVFLMFLVILAGCGSNKTYSVTFLDWNDNVLAVEYYNSNTDLTKIENAPTTNRYGFNFMLWKNLPEKMPKEDISVQATYISWWDVFRNYMIENGTKSIDSTGVWYKLDIHPGRNKYVINYNDAKYEEYIFNIELMRDKIDGSSSQMLILKYYDVFFNKTDYFYTLYDKNDKTIGYGMGPNTYIDKVSPKIEFMFTTLNESQIQEAKSDLMLLLQFFSEYFIDEINIPLI